MNNKIQGEKGKKYNSYWVTTAKDGEGVQINTHLKYNLLISDIYINSNNELLISYISIHGNQSYSRAILYDKEALTIDSI